MTDCRFIGDLLVSVSQVHTRFVVVDDEKSIGVVEKGATLLQGHNRIPSVFRSRTFCGNWVVEGGERFGQTYLERIGTESVVATAVEVLDASQQWPGLSRWHGHEKSRSALGYPASLSHFQTPKSFLPSLSITYHPNRSASSNSTVTVRS
jgi:hypothetical protein